MGSSINSIKTSDYAYGKNQNLFFIPYTNIDSRWIKFLKEKNKYFKFLEEYIENYLCDLVVWKHSQIRQKKKKCIHFKASCTWKNKPSLES